MRNLKAKKVIMHINISKQENSKATKIFYIHGSVGYVTIELGNGQRFGIYRVNTAL